MNDQQGIFFKAAQIDGRDFSNREVDYAVALRDGLEISIPEPTNAGRPAGLPVSTLPGEVLFRASWPCRLFQVVGAPVRDGISQVGRPRHIRTLRSLRVIQELDARQALGPNAAAVLAVLARVQRITETEAIQLVGAWSTADPSWLSAREATRAAAVNAGLFRAWRAAGIAARTAAGSICGYAAWVPDSAAPAWLAESAAQAAVVRGRISDDVDRVLTDPFEAVCGSAGDLLHIA